MLARRTAEIRSVEVQEEGAAREMETAEELEMSTDPKQCKIAPELHPN